MDVNNLRFGKIIARTPTKTLVREIESKKYFLINGGFIDSVISHGRKDKIIKFDISLANDGTKMAYLDKNKNSI